jgi:hypothetical protein
MLRIWVRVKGRRGVVVLRVDQTSVSYVSFSSLTTVFISLTLFGNLVSLSYYI